MADREIVSLDWQVGKTVDALTLTAWESQTGLTLPDDYRRFLIKYNGGVIKPWLFRHDHPHVDGDEREVMLDYLHAWDAVLKNSALDIKPELASQPPNHILIGQDPGGGAVLLSLQPENYGHVVYWLRVYLGWGEESNNVTGLIATSFKGFLDSLYLDEDPEHTYFEVLLMDRPAKPLIL